jgi:hypothetical protein
MRTNLQTEQRIVKHLFDKNGERVVHVPLDDEAGRHAILYEVDFEDLIDLGLSPIWRLKHDRKRDRVVVWNRATKQDTAIARLIAQAGPGQSVAHANGDPLDLRARNLVTGLGKGTRKDLDDIRPTNRFNYRTIVKHEYVYQA